MKKQHRSKYMRNQPKTFRIYHVNADNECLFNAIAYGILYYKKTNKVAKEGYKDLASRLRRKVIQVFNEKVENNDISFIERLCCEYIVLSGEDIPDEVMEESMINKKYAKKYIDQMKQKNTWGGTPEILALTKYIHKIGFKGIQVYKQEQEGEYKQIHSMCTNTKSNNKYPHISLLLHGVELGGVHFDFITNK